MFGTKKISRKLRRHIVYGLVAFGGVFVLAYGMLTHDRIVPGKTSFISNYTRQISKVILPIKRCMLQLIGNVNTITDSLRLVSENRELRKLVSQLQAQIKDCERLNTHRNTIETNTFRVLGFEQNIFNSSLLIDISSPNCDVKVGYVVKTLNGLVGLVTTISNHTALATTITNKSLLVPVKNKTMNSHKKNKHFVMNGTNRNKLISVAMMQNNITDVNSGDVLYTSGEGGVFPSNIPVARVIKVDNTIEAVPIVDFDNLEFVQIIKTTLPWYFY